jgi:hypothetical protein
MPRAAPSAGMPATRSEATPAARAMRKRRSARPDESGAVSMDVTNTFSRWTRLSPAGRHRQIGKRKTIDLLILETSHTDRGSIDSVNKFGKRIDCAASGRKYHHCSPPPGHLSTQVTNHALAAHAPKRSALERAGGIVKQFLDFQFSRNESLLQRVLDDGLQRPPAGIQTKR